MKVSLILFAVFLTCIHQVAATDDPVARTVYVASVILAIYIVINVVLIIILIVWCRMIQPDSHRYELDTTRRKISMEFYEAPVKLQIHKKRSDTSSSTSSQENGEAETSFQERQQKAKEKRISIERRLRESETHLLGDNQEEFTSAVSIPDVVVESEEVFKEDHSITPESQRRKSFEDRKKDAKQLRHQTGGTRKDSETPLLRDKSDEEEVHLPDISPIEEDNKLVSITSKITGAILPPDSPPHEIPREIRSLDISATLEFHKDSTATEETSFTGLPNDSNPNGSFKQDLGENFLSTPENGEDNLHSTSGVSIGFSSVLQTVQDIETDVTDTLNHYSKNDDSTSRIKDEPYPENTNNFTSMFDDILQNPLFSSLRQDERSKSLSPQRVLAKSHSHVVGSQHRSSDPGIILPTWMEQYSEQRGRVGSASASSTPTHRVKHN